MYQAMMYMHAAQAVNKQANKDSILFIDLEIRFIEVKDIISSYSYSKRFACFPLSKLFPK